MGSRRLEITDLLWPVDAGGAPVPVAKADVLNQLRAGGQHRAARIVSAFPAGAPLRMPVVVAVGASVPVSR